MPCPPPRSSIRRNPANFGRPATIFAICVPAPPVTQAALARVACAQSSGEEKSWSYASVGGPPLTRSTRPSKGSMHMRSINCNIPPMKVGACFTRKGAASGRLRYSPFLFSTRPMVVRASRKRPVLAGMGADGSGNIVGGAIIVHFVEDAQFETGRQQPTADGSCGHVLERGIADINFR